MSDDTDDHTIDLAEPYNYEDPVSQRVLAACATGYSAPITI